MRVSKTSGDPPLTWNRIVGASLCRGRLVLDRSCAIPRWTPRVRCSVPRDNRFTKSQFAF